MAKETKVFQAEVSEILDLMIHSLYSHKDLFLRELISNASDAIDKLRIESLTNGDLKNLSGSPEIRIESDKATETITIIDNGIGMSHADVMQNIGTIAHSGTKTFLNKIKEAKDNPDLIGQFGVGFYSAFMVAEKVTLHTQKAGETNGTLWESTGTGEFTIDDVPKAGGHGTKIIIKLKAKADDDESFKDFTDEWTIKSTVRKYSDFIAHPIKMEVSKEEAQLDEEGKAIEGKYSTVIEDQTLNSMKALWLKSPSDIEDKEYNEFYKQVCNDWNDPAKVIHYKAEGTQEFASLLYVPKNKPMDWGYREAKYGLSLYVKRVFILENCEDLIPTYLRFMKGLVDSSDLSLNVSREILQKDHQIAGIQKAVTSKVLRTLRDFLAKDRSEYELFWSNFGSVLKEGIAGDEGNKEKIIDLALFNSTASEKLTTLKEYVERMSDDQKEIYFLTGESLEQMAKSPYLEILKKKNFEVLFMTDAVDEWVVQSLKQYGEKDMVNISSERFNLEDDEQSEKQKEETQEKYKTLTDVIKKALDEEIKEVKISNRLVETPVCLVSGAYDQSNRMAQIMESMGQKAPKTKRIMEINLKHPVFEKMLSFDDNDKAKWAELLYNQALLNEGSPIVDPVSLSKQISDLMMKV